MAKGEKGRWVIDVCRTCGKHATYPFCEHYPRGFTLRPVRWTEPITVTGTWHPATTENPERTDDAS